MTMTFAAALAAFAADTLPAEVLIEDIGYERAREAEALGDKLHAAGRHAYMNRYGTGNGCVSGINGNGVASIEVTGLTL